MGDNKTAGWAEEFAEWLLPSRSWALACNVVGTEQARPVILQRLKGGIIKAAAATLDSDYLGHREGPVSIPKHYWDHLSNAGTNIWVTGDARFWLPPANRQGHAYAVLCFGIRFDRADVLASFPQATPAPLAEDPTQREPEQKWPPVSIAHLQAWYDLYRQVYVGALDTEDNALASARGMFPGKTVSRETVRNLRGPQKRGRKQGAS